MISWSKPVGPDYSLWQPIYLVNHDKKIWQGERGCKFGKGTIQVNINHCRVHFTFPKYIDQVITTCKRFDHLSCSLKKAQLVSKISGKANKSTLERMSNEDMINTYNLYISAANFSSNKNIWSIFQQIQLLLSMSTPEISNNYIY